MGLSEFLFKTKTGKKIMGMAYGLGASVVIVGALFKIEHWPGASAMLIVGLGTEALIFALSAFEPPSSDVDWTLVYPELAGLEDDALTEATRRRGGGSGDSVSQELDKMLEEAKIGPELIESLGNGFRKLSEHTEQLTTMSDASVVTEEYINSVQSASDKLNGLSHSYEQASEALTGLTVSSDASNDYSNSLKDISSKLAELNNVYELQLQAASKHMEASNETFEGMTSLMSNLKESVEGTERYKENINDLAQNLSSLNTIYGNMLNAMGGGRTES